MRKIGKLKMPARRSYASVGKIEKSFRWGLKEQRSECKASGIGESVQRTPALSMKSVNPCSTARRVAGVIQTKRVIIRVSALKFILFCLFLLFTPGCKCATDPQPADCDPGWHPCTNNPADCCMDTTSHSIDFWQIDTLGSPGTWSVLHDAAIIDENNVWAVGDISIIEEDGTWTRYNAAHWNGEEWEFIGFRGGLTNIVFPIYGVWLTEDSSVWISNGCGLYQYSNDTLHTRWVCDWQSGEIGVVSTIWGLSKDNIFFVGTEGTIVHYDGNTFTRMDSGTDVTLSSITGTGYDNVWVSGWVNSNGHYRTVLLHFDGNNWRKVVEMSPPYQVKEDSLSGWIRGVFTNRIDSVIVLTSKGLYKCPNGTMGEGMLIPGSAEILTSAMVGIDGIAENDLFIAGHFTRIIHYNGETFHEYEEIPYLGTPFGIDVSPDLIVIPGFLSSTAQAYVIRGYR